MRGEQVQNERVWGPEEIGRAVNRLAAEILQRRPRRERLAFVGIHHRGVPLAERVLEVARKSREGIEYGSVDISLYRDDFDNRGTIPTLKGSDISFPLEETRVILFDDVLFTGRTTRAAIDALLGYGRPACIELAVLVDRGNRELPIAANSIGLSLETKPADYVKVRLEEVDGEDAVYWERQPG